MRNWKYSIKGNWEKVHVTGRTKVVKVDIQRNNQIETEDLQIYLSQDKEIEDDWYFLGIDKPKNRTGIPTSFPEELNELHIQKQVLEELKDDLEKQLRTERTDLMINGDSIYTNEPKIKIISDDDDEE